MKNHGYIYPVSIHADVVKVSSKQAYPHTDGNQLWILFKDFYLCNEAKVSQIVVFMCGILIGLYCILSLFYFLLGLSVTVDGFKLVLPLCISTFEL